MTALAKDRKTDRVDTDSVIPKALSFPAEADTILYAGGILATNAAGNAVPASAISALKCWGRIEKTVDNRTVAHGGPTAGTAGLQFAECKPGAYFFNNGTGINACGLANVGAYVYAADDNTASLTDVSGTLPLLGIMLPGGATTNLRSTGSGEVAVLVGMASPYQLNPELASGSTAFRARNVAAAGNVTLTAFTVASNDGVTNVAGDVVLLLEQTSAAANGPYVVGTVATGTAPLTRPDWFPTGATLQSGLKIRLGGEGTVFKNTDFRAFVAADTFVVGTTDAKFYPENVSGATALSSGTFTVSTVPIFSANSAVHLERRATGGTVTSTIGYHATAAGADGITIGIRGTAAAVIQAVVTAGTINTADTSTLHWTIVNQA
jgi:hypothetical protein